MNGGDKVLQARAVEHYHPTGNFAISSWLGPLLFGSRADASVIVIERFGWWLHIGTVFAFLCYLPYSKHLHIILAFPNTWYASLSPKGKMSNMPEIQTEVRAMMGLPPLNDAPGDAAPSTEFGANGRILIELEKSAFRLLLHRAAVAPRHAPPTRPAKTVAPKNHDGCARPCRRGGQKHRCPKTQPGHRWMGNRSFDRI